jgi:hypothetical protein
VKMASPSRRLHAPINTRERKARRQQVPSAPRQGGEHASEEVVVVAGYKWVWRGR